MLNLRNTSNDVKKIVIKINELDRDDKLKFISYIFNLCDRNQINSLNNDNPNLLDNSIDIEIFNSSSIDYPYLVEEIDEYCNYTFNLFVFIQENIKN